MGKYRRRRVVWVPRGYRLKSRYRKTNKILSPEATAQEDTAVSSPEAADETPPVSQAHQDSSSAIEPLMQEAAEVTSKTNTESKLAEFDAGFNPYQSYVQDLARCLTSMPKGVFSNSTDEQPEAANDSGDAGAPVDDRKKPSEPARPKSGSERSRLEPSTAPPAASEAKATASVNEINWCQPSSYPSDSGYPHRFEFVASEPAVHKQKTAMPAQDNLDVQEAEKKRKTPELSGLSKPDNQSRRPHLRWLTGVRSCMRATDHQ
ncbi:hypothetical protein [Vibrio neptunius]|uniref:Uncharacterized protein n=1 Tax=Vibrio neptunius TaxID=170651 RepID=A0ABS2ZY98_9VIBR|nr:hypothetical protein [Vibrio neptunius]MBN3492615.1 hypothetical protein [Vibrio neptunius]MBN3515112.1 hypothetical protein [Vibrio neptunius]MBN3548628.1 hypothetical protein [Vibrio neptunius]MBN3577240.1 hypothetical protein [Vibrio neptunius]MCH9870905.1 hypothetical protein [Vibrio neptunius]